MTPKLGYALESLGELKIKIFELYVQICKLIMLLYTVTAPQGLFFWQYY